MLTRNDTRAPFNTIKRVLLLAGSVSVLAVAMTAPAFAQASGSETISDTTPGEVLAAPIATGEQIVVTGSRIVQRDYEASSPIVTVDSTLLENSSNVAIEANLNKLPQFAPAGTQFSEAGAIQPGATVTPGAATLSLRGLGPNRTLVLIDGRRGTPVNALGAIDINSIPSAAIERIETITGGASATYGADAVAGVVNFILKKNYSGLTVDGQYGITQRGDGQEYRISALAGTNFDDGRGNIIFNVEHFRRGRVLQIDRELYRDRFADPSVAGNEAFPRADYFTPDFLNPPSRAGVDTVFSRAPGQVPVSGSPLYFNTDGTLFGGVGGLTGGAGSRAGAYKYNGPLDTLTAKLSTIGTLEFNDEATPLTAPAERWSFFARSEYEITDSVSFLAQAYYAKTETSSVSQFPPASSGFAALIPYGTNIFMGNQFSPSSLNPDGTTNAAYLPGGSYGLNCAAVGGCTESQVFPVPQELAVLLNSRARPNEPWVFNNTLEDLGRRSSDNDSHSTQLLVGLNGEISGTDWTWEIYGTRGETLAKSTLTGFGSRERYRAIVRSPNFGVNFAALGNLAPPGNNFGGGSASCTSGVMPFSRGGNAWSDDCVQAIQAILKTSSTLVQNVVEANLQGGLFELPAGDLRFAVGADYQRNTFDFENDNLNTNGMSFLDGPIGLFPGGNTSGRTTAKEVYGELLIPILADMPFVEELTLNVGYRYSDYDTVGGIGTYKILADYSPTDWLRFRGGYQKASRAPNVGELYQSPQQTFFFSARGDPCSRLNPVANYSANPNVNADGATGAAATEQLCRALMGPSAANAYYSNPQNGIAAAAALPVSQGNPNLDAETAKTYTIGGVLESPLNSPLLSQLRLTVDYYNIKLDEAIANETVDTVSLQCFSPAYNPTYDPNNSACRRLVRDPTTGVPNVAFTSFGNFGRVRTSGIDFHLDWGVDLTDAGFGLPGNFGVNFLGTYLLALKTTGGFGLPLVDYAGTIGPPGTAPNIENGLNAGAFRLRTYTTISYSLDGSSLRLSWRRLPSVGPVEAATNPDTPVLGASSWNIFDLSGTHAITDDLVLRAGVDNLFDNQAPVIGINSAPPPGNLPGGSINSGYYDTLGRRFFVGMKASF